MSIINEKYLDLAQIEPVALAFQSRASINISDGPRVDSKVYPLAIFPNFLQPEFASELRSTLLGQTSDNGTRGNINIPFAFRATDLYEFWQSKDLKRFVELGSQQCPLLTKLCQSLFSRSFFDIVEGIIARPLDHVEIDFAAQKYTQQQYLLCHDDRLDDRRVAFVLYLVDPEWQEEDGGHFEMFYTDPYGSPTCTDSQKFLPRWNTLIFFEVSIMSHHQVCEVLGSLPRLSVAGWFHDSGGRANVVANDTGRLDRSLVYTRFCSFSELLPYFSFASSRLQLCVDSVQELSGCITDLFIKIVEEESKSRPIERMTFLSGVSSYVKHLTETTWMKLLLRPEFRMQISKMLDRQLDWFSRPILYCLEESRQVIPRLDGDQPQSFILIPIHDGIRANDYIMQRNSLYIFEAPIDRLLAGPGKMFISFSCTTGTFTETTTDTAADTVIDATIDTTTASAIDAATTHPIMPNLDG